MYRYPLVIALVVGIIAGCGGGGGIGADDDVSREDFEERVTEVRGDVEAALREMRDARSQEDLADGLEQAAEELRVSAEELRDTDAPPDAEQAAERLVSAMERLADELEAASERVDDGDLDALREQARGFDLDALSDIESALAELRRQGYDVGRLER